jgi:predicted hotdog family 3-hydroxylacyl-ACP dehydratase
MTEPWTLEQLLPHRAPMLLLDELIHCDDDGSEVALSIHPHSAFFDAGLGGVPAWVGIEYMAQAVATWSGFQQLSAGQPVTIGFLLGSRRYQSQRPVFQNGERLVVTAKARYVEPGALAAFDCCITDAGGELLAEATINAFRPNDPQQFVRQAKPSQQEK